MIKQESVQSAMNNGNVAVAALTKRGLFVEAGVVSSLLLVIQALWQALNPPKIEQSKPELASVPAEHDGTRDGV